MLTRGGPNQAAWHLGAMHGTCHHRRWSNPLIQGDTGPAIPAIFPSAKRLAMIIRILGPIEMSRDGELIPLGAAKQRAVLAVLAMEAGRFVSVDSLIDRVWGTDPPDRPLASLHAYTSRLRGALAREGYDAGRAALKYGPAGYVLAIDPAQVDLHQARHLAAAATAAETEEAAAMMARALRGWGSHPLAGVDGEWAASKRA